MNSSRSAKALSVASLFAFAIGGFSPSALASATVNGQTFYSTNSGLTTNGNNLVWVTPAGVNGEMHTHFGPFTLAVGETFVLNFGLNFAEPQGDGGSSVNDGIRIGLLDVTTQSSRDGAKTATTGEGYRYRFNYEQVTTTEGGLIHERTSTGSSVNYLTTSGGIWEQGQASFNGFELNADGTNTYPISYSVQRTTATDALVTLTVNGISRTYNDTGDGYFTFDTFALAKIGDTGTFTDASTITISNFSTAVVPEPSTGLLMLAGLLPAVRRRRS